MSMAMRVAKYPPLPSLGMDVHPKDGAPAWAVTMVNYPSSLIFGKFTLTTITEFQTDILQGYDWGMLQPHIPVPPNPVAAKSVMPLTLGSSHKYFLPAYTVVETPQGGVLALASASATPMAIALPVACISVEDCCDPVALPTGISFHLPTTRWLGFGLMDLLAAGLSLVMDAASDTIVGAHVDAVLPDALADTVQGAALSAVLNAAASTALEVAEGFVPEVDSPTDAVVVGLIAHQLGPLSVPLLGGRLVDAVGEMGRTASPDGPTRRSP